MKNNILELKNLKKYYGQTRGIENVSLQLKPGEIYGFIGPNGAGKSTTLKTIVGLINKTAGDIYIKEQKIDNDNPEIKKIIGYLPSEINLYNDMTVKQILDYHQTFYQKNINKRRQELVKLLKINETKKIEDLSLGNLKKVGIVLALMHNPEIIILDEPTSGLDPIMQKTLHEILLKEKQKGKAILYSSHVLSEVYNLCDKIGFIKNGEIIKEDTIDNFKKQNYTHLIITSKDINKIKKELNLKIINQTTEETKFINNLDPNDLIKKLSKYDIQKLLIEEISLEDLFINYYK